jgi:hypothetical protein
MAGEASEKRSWYMTCLVSRRLYLDSGIENGRTFGASVESVDLTTCK